ncbi:putative ADP-ribosylation factor GTPase-activating protein AGD14 [Apostasia shenzhenica]|uniref:Putative ADP-ribosylation factor GTPase-activating protein AGD14 n=1 Tax=Apostasia shenzhenica TaxID=1088818 RepID=A0A2I0BGL5_9ASPA|nr:putative ADP-ribosylation factor GTPase-activating protein AGD14 [Apostasia shenzhenica]
MRSSEPAATARETENCRWRVFALCEGNAVAECFRRREDPIRTHLLVTGFSLSSAIVKFETAIIANGGKPKIRGGRVWIEGAVDREILIRREFTHRVKSVSMAKFTTQEVQALQVGGNQRARELFLKTWDMQRMRFPDNSNPDKIREFIKTVYMDKKYAGERPSDRPPRDTQGLKNHEEHRRASSYHSYSQSPPYDHQYEERRYGKQGIMLTRKPGSDRGYEGKISSFFYSPGRAREHVYEDQFANDRSGSRVSDYSHSSTGDPFRSGGQSPTGYSSPPSQQVRDILIADACASTLPTYSECEVKREVDKFPCPHRSASGSFCSSNGNSASLKAANSNGLVDSFFKREHDTPSQKKELSTVPSSKLSTPAYAAFTPQFDNQEIAKTSLVDSVSDCSQQSSSTLFSDKIPSEMPIQEDKGWATFDIPQHCAPEPQRGLPAMSACIAMDHQWQASIDQVQNLTNSSGLQIWNDFNIPSERKSLTSFTSLSSNDQSLVNKPSISSDQYADMTILKGVTTQERKSTNPFDQLFDSEPEADNVFLNMNSLQVALPTPSTTLPNQQFPNAFLDGLSLPNQQFPNAFLDGLSQQWFQQNSVTDYMHSATPGKWIAVHGRIGFKLSAAALLPLLVETLSHSCKISSAGIASSRQRLRDSEPYNFPVLCWWIGIACSAVTLCPDFLVLNLEN